MAISKDTKLSIVIEADADDAGFIDLTGHVDKLGKSLDGLKAAGEKPVGTFTAFKGAMKAVGEVMTPFNQGLEIGKKLLGFAEEGLDAYAKTSRQAAADVKALTGEFAFYKKTVLEAAGEITVALGKSLNFDQINEAARRAAATGSLTKESFGKAYGDINKQWNALNDTVLDSGKAFGALADSLGDTFGVIGDKVAKNATANMEAAVARARELAVEYKKIGTALLGNETPSQRAIRQGAQSRAEFQAGIDADVAQMQADERTNALIANAGGNFKDNMARVTASIAEMRQNLAQVQGARQQSLLESVFGPVEQVDLYKQSFEALGSTFGAFTQAMGAGYQALVTGSQPIGAAMKQVAASSILAAGTASVIDGARETALGFGSIALGPLGGASAAAHFKSAALHAGVAAIAGIAAHSLGTGGSPGGAGSASGGGGGGGSSGGGFGGGGSSPPQTVTNYVLIGDSHSDDSPRMRQRNAQRTLELAQSRTSAGRAE